jgi:hypothetical protein
MYGVVAVEVVEMMPSVVEDVDHQDYTIPYLL